jgi:hypothetical protein
MVVTISGQHLSRLPLNGPNGIAHFAGCGGTRPS